MSAHARKRRRRDKFKKAARFEDRLRRKIDDEEQARLRDIQLALAAGPPRAWRMHFHPNLSTTIPYSPGELSFQIVV